MNREAWDSMRLRQEEDGFTLIELILAIVITGIITVPLGGVLSGYLHNADTTTERLIESHDVQLASAYWAQDVASVGTRETASPYPLKQESVETDVAYDDRSHGNQCGAAGTPPAIVRFAWDDFPDVELPAKRVVVAYVVQGAPDQKTPTELHRIRCEDSVLLSDVTLAHELDPDALPLLSCSFDWGRQTACSPPPSGHTVPRTVTITLTIKADPGSLDAPYVVELTGQRRQS